MSIPPIGLDTGDQEQLRRQARLLSDWLDEWDPLRVHAGEPADEHGHRSPSGEYDCLVWPLLGMLRSGAEAARIAAHLHTQLDDHLGGGGSADDAAAVADRLLRWWAGLDHEPRVLEPPLAAALVERALLPVEDTPLLAAHWLVSGVGGGPALARLAGLGRRDLDLHEHWAAAVAELDLRPADPWQDLAALIWTARRITAGELPVDVVWTFSPDARHPDHELDELVWGMASALDGAELQDERSGRPTGQRTGWPERLPHRSHRATGPRDRRHDIVLAIAALADEDTDAARRLLRVPAPPD